jgi:hypothetical protein
MERMIANSSVATGYAALGWLAGSVTGAAPAI